MTDDLLNDPANIAAAADTLIAAAGEQAYHDAVKMTVRSVQTGDDPGAAHFAAVARELLRRGWHKRGRA